MNKNNNTFKGILGASLILFTVFGLSSASANTLVCGDASGTWDVNGSPYLVACDVTVPAGEVLTIEPGVKVMLYDTLSINVYGQILAVGTPNQRITFTPITEDQRWNRIYISGSSASPPVSEFKYCDFSGAETALYASIYGKIVNDWTTMGIDIANCNFTNTVITAIYGEAIGVDASQYLTPRRLHARLNPVIENCVVDGANKGIELYAQGVCNAYCAAASSEPTVRNNMFVNLTESAFTMLPAPVQGASVPVFVNNTVVNSGNGVTFVDPFDVQVTNNIFYGNGTAVQKPEPPLGVVYFNDFFGNEIDCIGCPVSFGDTILLNANGDPSDIGSNIFMDPLLVSESDPHLTTGSPAINAGTSDNAPDTDIDSNPRPQEFLVEIGADEVCELDLDGDGICDGEDNCILVANGPLSLDAGGNIQLDTDGDGYGNICDPDLDNNGVIQAADLALFKPLYFSSDPDADFDGNGVVQAADLAIIKTMYFGSPGPSCCPVVLP